MSRQIIWISRGSSGWRRLIAGGSFATLIVSHDRRFLEAIANRIIDLGRAYPEGFLSHNGTYSEFLVKREEFLAAACRGARQAGKRAGCGGKSKG